MKYVGALLLLLVTGVALAQAPVDITADSHFHLQLQNDSVRVFSVDLPPQQRAYVRHEHNYLLLTPRDSELVIWPEGASDITAFQLRAGDVHFFFGKKAQGLKNQTSNTYDGVIVEFLDPKVTSYGYQSNTGTWDFGANALQPPVDPHAAFSNSIKLGPAKLTELQILPGGDWEAPEKLVPELVIPVTDVDLKASENNRIRKGSGEAVWMPAGRNNKYANVTNDPARLVVVDFGQEEEKGSQPTGPK